MDSAIIEQLSRLTREEQDILRGKSLQRGDYTTSDRFIVNSAKFLEGKELDLRPHTRFVDFPEHGHDYLEFMYVYAGRISHVIGKEVITLVRGDIIFLNRPSRWSAATSSSSTAMPAIPSNGRGRKISASISSSRMPFSASSSAA